MVAWALSIAMVLSVLASQKPNILVIMTDDMGYSDLGCMGGEIQTPNLDALAANGVCFTQFYNTARCCPTRASLLTGLHPHAAGMGHMGTNTGLPGYTGSIHSRCVTIAEVVKPAGYRTYAVGKWHVTHPYGPNGPFTHYPLQRGFDKFYGTITGAGSYYDPTTLCRGNTFITPENDSDYQPKSFYYTDALTDNAIRFLKQHRAESADQPFFMYLTYTAAHWPLHAKPEDIAKYKGQYDAGYDAIRKRREAKMRQLGLLDPQWKATPTVGDFSEVKDKKWEARCMEVYAAMVDCMDQGVGRIVAELKANGQLDNTLILYLQDNGACAEPMGRDKRTIPEDLQPRDKNWLQPCIWPPMQTRDGRPVLTGPSVIAGPENTYLSYGKAWANASNTPYREYKHWVHEGGISTPLIAHWPAGMKGTTKGRLIVEPGQLPDILATCADIAGATYPKLFKGNEIVPMAGKSLKPMLVSDTGRLQERMLFWEHEGNRAVRIGKWKLVAKAPAAAWELYDMSKDRTELNDLAFKHPDRVKTMVAAWENWAYANKVLPWPWKPAYTPTQPRLPSKNAFVNPIGEGADPWVVRDAANDRYLWCMSEGNQAIAVHTSRDLSSMGRKHIVWHASKEDPCSKEVWAPELHLIDGRWYIYFAASNGRNENHLAYVLKSKTANPLGDYELFGPFATGDGADGRSPNVWAIDMTVLEVKGKQYAVWSGWDAPGTDRQFLYIAPMKSPLELAGPRVRICSNDDFAWERTEPGPEGRGLNEAPQVLQRDGRTFLIYSCGAGWLPSYKLGLLELTGENPLDPAAWRKHAEPVFSGTRTTYGIGHSCFVHSPDGKETWHVYHAKRDEQPGFRRHVFIQPMHFDETEFPLFGSPMNVGELQKRPSGEVPATAIQLPFRQLLKDGAGMDVWRYFGHHQYFSWQQDGLHLGIQPESPVNAYRCGEKMVLDAPLPSDFSAEVTIDFLGNTNARDAGILFRVSRPSVGYDAQCGYFAGLHPSHGGRVVLGRMDGFCWEELVIADFEFDPARPHRLRVDMVKDCMTILCDGEQILTFKDTMYPVGTCGLRVVDTHAIFSDFSVTVLTESTVTYTHRHVPYYGGQGNARYGPLRMWLISVP